MTDHLSTLQVKQLCVSALPEDDLVAAAVHTAECQSCHQRFVEELRHQRGSVPFTFTLEPQFWFRNEHVDFDFLVALADKTIDQETEEIIKIHLNTCEPCREEVRSFVASRKEAARARNMSYGPTGYQSIQARSARWWQRPPARSIYAVAAIVAIAVAVIITVTTFNKKSGSLEASKQGQTTPHRERTPDVSTSPTPPVVSSPTSIEDAAAKVAILKDGSGKVTIDSDGRVAGLDQASEKIRDYVARAALSERIEQPGVLQHLSDEQSGLRGSNSGGQEFRLLYPVQSVVIEDRPVFHWDALSLVYSYQVYVLDAYGKEVVRSEELDPNQTQWKAPTHLRRGQIFSWAVIASRDGEKVVSPSASAPEIKFAVLSAADFRELKHLKKSNSHFALGVFYARTGLLTKAEREFEKLVELNPQSRLPKKLLDSVRRIRGPD